MSKEAMKLALEALEDTLSDDPYPYSLESKAITALREALAKPDFWEGYVPEPVKPAQYSDIVSDGGLDPRNSFDQPAQQEPVAWPAGLIERIKSAEQRIQDGHAPRRIPADPTDVDLVLAEVRYLLEGKQPPFWVATSPPAQRTWVGLVWGELPEDGQNHDFLRGAVWAETKLKEKNQ